MGLIFAHHHWIYKLDAADWIAIISIVVNAILAYWIITTIQKNLENKRVLKDHFITEIKEIKEEFKKILNKAFAGELKPKTLPRWFKLMGIKIDEILKLLSTKYGIPTKTLDPYKIELREILMSSEEFEKSFKKNECINLSEETLNKIIVFQQTHSSSFNNLIIKINDA